MKSLWDDEQAAHYENDPLEMRVYSSRLLGKDPTLVLHGGGNTSVKATATDLFGEEEDVLYVKGSGWDLATIEAPGFAAVKLDILKRMASLEQLTDSMMVKGQRAAMMDPAAPNPSVEAILHAIIPYVYVDHTHTDAMITLTNTADGENIIEAIYGDRVLVIPYVMPGFDLARKVFQMSQSCDWGKIEGMVLMNHGLFSFADDAKTSYERMIDLVTIAEEYLREREAMSGIKRQAPEAPLRLQELALLRRDVSRFRGKAVVAKLNDSEEACGFSLLENVADIATRGPLTPDHVIRTKRIPLMLGADGGIAQDVESYAQAYSAYFDRLSTAGLSCLDQSPRWAVWPGQGTVSFGLTMKEADIIGDINRHTVKAIQWAEALGGWQALPEEDIFAVEYWELEQAKLGKGGVAPQFQGKVALVTGAASGIGKACAEALISGGACVVALDINADVTSLFSAVNALGIVCDVTSSADIDAAVSTCVKHFGGLDILINNAGLFPPSLELAQMTEDVWDKSIALNLTSQQRMLTAASPYLKLGVDPAVIFIASKNVPAPGPGAGAYSVAKAGVTQLARVAALELGASGIRVNTVHPNAVFDTAIWSEEILHKRAAHYGVSVEEYKTNNILKTEITSADVAATVCALAGPAFAKTTGAQLAIDGGNDRVI